MYWKGKVITAVFLTSGSSGTGYSVWEDIEQADCHRSDYRISFSGDGTSGLGHMVFSSERIGSDNSFVSFISNACPWGRRHQIIFHDRQYTYILGIIKVHVIWFFDCRSRCSFIFGSR